MQNLVYSANIWGYCSVETTPKFGRVTSPPIPMDPKLAQVQPAKVQKNKGKTLAEKLHQERIQKAYETFGQRMKEADKRLEQEDKDKEITALAEKINNGEDVNPKDDSMLEVSFTLEGHDNLDSTADNLDSTADNLNTTADKLNTTADSTDPNVDREWKK